MYQPRLTDLRAGDDVTHLTFSDQALDDIRTAFWVIAKLVPAVTELHGAKGLVKLVASCLNRLT